MTTLKILNDDTNDNVIIRKSFKLPVFNSPPSNNINVHPGVVGDLNAFTTPGVAGFNGWSMGWTVD